MARIGLKNFRYSELDENENVIAPKSLGKAIDCKVSLELNSAELYGDDALAESDYTFNKGSVTISIDDDDDKVGVARFFMALISLAFAVYMVPGLWGAPLKAVSAFAPPMNTQDFNLYTNEVHAQFDDYDAGMEYAKRTGKPVMLDFTGYGCVNCRKMEAAVWTDPKVNKLMTEDYVLITLFVDNKTPLPEHIKVMENGKERTLRTIGDKWSYLQRSKFGANAQPFYVLIDNEGKPLNKSYSYDEDIDKYVDFLQTGLQNYKK